MQVKTWSSYSVYAMVCGAVCCDNNIVVLRTKERNQWYKRGLDLRLCHFVLSLHDNVLHSIQRAHQRVRQDARRQNGNLNSHLSHLLRRHASCIHTVPLCRFLARSSRLLLELPYRLYRARSHRTCVHASPDLTFEGKGIRGRKAFQEQYVQVVGFHFQEQGLRVFVASDIMYWIGLTLFQTGLPFFVKVSMQLPELMVMVLMGVMTVLSAAVYPFVTKLVKKFGKKNLVIIGFFGLAVAYVVAGLTNLPGIASIPALGYVLGFAICLIAAFPMALLGIIPQSIVADVAEAEAVTTGENREGMFFAARTFSMKLGQSIAMLAFTSLAIIGTVSQDKTSNDITANPIGLGIVAIVAIVFCVLGAIILFFYREKKVMKLIAKESDAEFLAAVEKASAFDKFSKEGVADAGGDSDEEPSQTELEEGVAADEPSEDSADEAAQAESDEQAEEAPADEEPKEE